MEIELSPSLQQMPKMFNSKSLMINFSTVGSFNNKSPIHQYNEEYQVNENTLQSPKYSTINVSNSKRKYCFTDPKRNCYQSPEHKKPLCKLLSDDPTFLVQEQNFKFTFTSHNLDQDSSMNLAQLDFPRCSTPTKGRVNKYDIKEILETPNKQNSRQYALTSVRKRNSHYEENLMRDEDFRSYQILEDYTFIQYLGQGHYGNVKKYQNKIDNNFYAIKQLKKRYCQSKMEIVNEVTNMAKLTAVSENQYIVRYNTAWMDSTNVYLVMEYCSGGALSQYKQNNKLDEEKIKQILRDICCGLKELHKNNIAHLDIKPENILYTGQCYKLGDLGLSRISKIRYGEYLQEGDSRYLAKETLNGPAKGITMDLTKADIFSLGATIYELMIGQDLPNNGDEWHNLREGFFPKMFALDNFSSQLKELIARMMRLDPKDRPTAEGIYFSLYLQDQALQLKWEKHLNQFLKQQLQKSKNQLDQSEKQMKMRNQSHEDIRRSLKFN